MASSSVQNPPAQSESKSSKKKKAKAAAEQTESPAQAATPEQAASVSGGNNDASDNAYVKELKKLVDFARLFSGVFVAANPALQGHPQYQQEDRKQASSPTSLIHGHSRGNVSNLYP